MVLCPQDTQQFISVTSLSRHLIAVVVMTETGNNITHAPEMQKKMVNSP